MISERYINRESKMIKIDKSIEKVNKLFFIKYERVFSSLGYECDKNYFMRDLTILSLKVMQ
jgi:hypothetical protein